MTPHILPRALALSLALALGGPAAVHADPLPAVWNLSPLYASDADWEAARQSLLADLPKLDRKSTRLNSSHLKLSRMPSSA